jgi:hypothetical protein
MDSNASLPMDGQKKAPVTVIPDLPSQKKKEAVYSAKVSTSA